MADEEQFSLCWNNFNSNLSAGFHESLCRGDLVDVTLAAEGQLVKAHRLVLSVCSPYFRKMFTQMPPNQHAFVFLKDVSHAALKDLIQFMYCGEVNVKQDALPAFISTAEALQIKGLTETGETTTAAAQQSPSKPTTPAPSNAASTITSPRSRMQRNVSRTSYKLESESETDEKQVSGGQKRVQQRSVTPQATPVAKRPKNNDPLEASESTTHILTTASDTKSMGEPEFIDLPIETIPTKSEPDYGDDTGDVEPVEQETGYVEDDSYGEMKYDESYFTENDDAKPGASGFTETYGGAEGDTSVTEAQGNKWTIKIVKNVRPKYPFEDPANFQIFESSCKRDPNVLKELEKTFLATSANAPKLFIQRNLRMLLTDYAAYPYSWAGVRGNIPIQSFGSIKCLIDTTLKKFKNSADFTLARDTVKNWFNDAKDRYRRNVTRKNI